MLDMQIYEIKSLALMPLLPILCVCEDATWWHDLFKYLWDFTDQDVKNLVIQLNLHKHLK